jgi:hypothetical protein
MIDAYLFSRRFDEAWFDEKQGFNRDPVGDWRRACIRAIQVKKDDAWRLGRQWASAQADPLSVAELFSYATRRPSIRCDPLPNSMPY